MYLQIVKNYKSFKYCYKHRIILDKVQIFLKKYMVRIFTYISEMFEKLFYSFLKLKNKLVDIQKICIYRHLKLFIAI